MTDLDRVDPTGVADEARDWVRVCRLDQLMAERGVAAMVRGLQLALFRVSASDEVFALANRDPFSGAQVLARGIVGDAGGVPKVASPVYKQSFDLRTGRCLDDPTIEVPTYPVRIEGEWIHVEVPR